MKKILIPCAAVLLAAGLLINGCKKDSDTTAPVISLSGSSSMTLVLNASAPSDPGASADDGSTVSSTWSSTNPNMNLAGTYTITYTATDAAGNAGSASRTVIVRNDAYYLAGTYGVSETPGGTLWSQTVTASTTQNNVIIFGKFANYLNNTAITGKVIVGTPTYVILSPNSQNAAGVGTSPYNCDHTFVGNGNGVAVIQSSGKWGFSVKFTDATTGGPGASCSVIAATAFEDAMLQQ